MIKELRLEDLPINTTNGFCTSRPKANGKTVFQDRALQFIKPFKEIKIIHNNKLTSNKITLLATLKLDIHPLDEFYLLRIYYKSIWLGVRIGSDINIDYEDRTIRFNVDVRNKQWHRIGLSITKTKITLFFDCSKLEEYLIDDFITNRNDDYISKIEFGSKYNDGSPGFQV